MVAAAVGALAGRGWAERSGKGAGGRLGAGGEAGSGRRRSTASLKPQRDEDSLVTGAGLKLASAQHAVPAGPAPSRSPGPGSFC